MSSSPLSVSEDADNAVASTTRPSTWSDSLRPGAIAAGLVFFTAAEGCFSWLNLSWACLAAALLLPFIAAAVSFEGAWRQTGGLLLSRHYWVGFVFHAGLSFVAGWLGLCLDQATWLTARQALPVLPFAGLFALLTAVFHAEAFRPTVALGRASSTGPISRQP
ncbi:MAG: hypothetical protein VKP62_00940 [Candidatus Sericytochromatia bacterium]|nr:hypothetical protein [Candidatus Sericytochromatia bacterium]